MGNSTEKPYSEEFLTAKLLEEAEQDRRLLELASALADKPMTNLQDAVKVLSMVSDRIRATMKYLGVDTPEEVVDAIKNKNEKISELQDKLEKLKNGAS